LKRSPNCSRFMNFDFFRCALLIGSSVLLLGTDARSIDEQTASQPEGERISTIERLIGGRVGIAVFDAANGRSFKYHATDRFPMCSTFKFLAAAAVLQRIDQKHEHLD